MNAIICFVSDSIKSNFFSFFMMIKILVQIVNLKQQVFIQLDLVTIQVNLLYCVRNELNIHFKKLPITVTHTFELQKSFSQLNIFYSIYVMNKACSIKSFISERLNTNSYQRTSITDCYKTSLMGLLNTIQYTYKCSHLG